jgi:hypothetical protein
MHLMHQVSGLLKSLDATFPAQLPSAVARDTFID